MNWCMNEVYLIKKAIDEMPKGPVLFVDGSTVKILG